DGGLGLGSADRAECRPAHRPRMEELPSRSADAVPIARLFGGRGRKSARPGGTIARTLPPSCNLLPEKLRPATHHSNPSTWNRPAKNRMLTKSIGTARRARRASKPPLLARRANQLFPLI